MKVSRSRWIWFCALVLCLGYAISFAVAESGSAKAMLNFALENVKGQRVSLSDFRGKNIVLEWFNPGCPFVKKHYAAGSMQQLQKEALSRGIVWLTIASTSREHHDFLSAEALTSRANEWGYQGSSILMDPDGVVGRLFNAKTTPHMFIIGKNGERLYSGAIDDVPDTTTDPKSAHNFVQDAIQDITAGVPLRTAETEPYGCSVKYGA